MKKFKALTDGLAILLAVLILIYLAVNFVKFKPDTLKTEKGYSKLYQFFDKTDSYRDYMRLVILLCLSCAVSMIFRKIPELSVLTSFSVVAYILTMYSNKQLSEHPMVIIILSLCHSMGCLIYCAYRDRFEKKRHLGNASLLCSLGSLGLTGYTLIYLLKFDSVKDLYDKIAAQGISLSQKIKYDIQFVSLVYEKLINFGSEEARELALSLAYDTEVSSLKNYFLSCLEPDQLKSYTYLLIFILVSALLILRFRNKLKFLPVLISAVPSAFVLVKIHTEKLSSFPLALAVMTFAAFLCCFAEFDQYGKGHDSAYDPEGSITDEEGEKPEYCTDEEEVFYS